MRAATLAVFAVAGLLAAGCPGPPVDTEQTMNRLAETYVRLVLTLGQHDADYVDAYFGPATWRAEAETEGLDLAAIRERAQAALAELAPLKPDAEEPLGLARHLHLLRSLESLIARVDQLSGVDMTFDEESRALYDAVAPTHPEAYFREILTRLEASLPGSGSAIERWESFRQSFVIPPERLDAVFQAAIDACREKTLEHLALPAEESFTVEYVSDKSWSAYNWYQGGYRSLIQVNTDLPVHIDRALDLACHEGYPGHHVYNVLVERDLAKGRGWAEFTVYPLFSPRSLIAEGSANFGIEVAFPAGERLAFEREVLFPLAGLEPETAAAYYAYQEMVKELGYAGNEAARRYLDGEIDAAAAAGWLERYALMPPARAEQRVRFIDQYRAYVINYNLGQDLVRDWVERQGGTPEAVGRRWQLFAELLSSPTLPSALK